MSVWLFRERFDYEDALMIVFGSVEWLPSRMSLIDLVRGKKIALWHKVPSMPDMGGGDEW